MKSHYWIIDVPKVKVWLFSLSSRAALTKGECITRKVLLTCKVQHEGWQT